MTKSQAAELPHTASSSSFWKSLNSKDGGTTTTTSVHPSDLFVNHTKELMERAMKGHSWIHGGATGLGEERSDESEQDDSVDDLIDMIDRSDPHGWTPSSGSSVQDLFAPEEEPRSPPAPTHSTKEPWSPPRHSTKETQSLLTHSTDAILLSEGFPSDAESEELLMVSDSEDEDGQDANASFRLGISKSPEIPITPNTSFVSRSTTSQDTSPAVPAGVTKAGRRSLIGQIREESGRAGSDASEGLVVVDSIAEQSDAENLRDGDTDDNRETMAMSDDNMSVCSMVSGPSGPPVYGPGGLCGRCLGLSNRMRRLNSSSQRRVKDPSNPYYDQWMLLKPWCLRGILGYRREKGKLFDNLSSIWRRAKGRAEGEPESQHDSCTRPHVFMQRTLRQCQRVLKKKKSASRKAKAKAKRKPSSYSLPPLNRSMAQRQSQGRSTKHSAKKKGKMSVVEEQRREMEMWKRKMMLKKHEETRSREKEMRGRDEDDSLEQRRREEQRRRHEESRRRDKLSSQGTKDTAKRKKSGVVEDQRKRRDKEMKRSDDELASSDRSTEDSVKKGKRSIISQQRRRDEERRNRRHAEMKRSKHQHHSHHSSPEDLVKKGKRSVKLEQRRLEVTERSSDDLASQHSSQPQSLELNAPSLCNADGLTDTDTDSSTQANEQPAAEVDLEMASDTEERGVSVTPAENHPPPTDVPRTAPEDTARTVRSGLANGPVEVRERGQNKDLLVYGHADNKVALQAMRVAEHTRGGACINPACLNSVRQPVVILQKCDSIDESLCTAEELEQTRPASQQLSATHRQTSTDTCPGKDAAVAKANNHATHEDVCVGKNMERKKKHHNDTVSTTTNGSSGMGQSVHSNRPPLTNVSQVLNDCRRARTEDINSLDCDYAATDHKRKLHLSHSAPARAPPTATAISGVSRLSKSAKSKNKLTQPPREEEKKKEEEEEDDDLYAFRTPTPPEMQSCEPVRKLRPFARTYETGRAQPEDSGLRSMLCALDRNCSTVVREHDT
ncbi:uncharacterized protein LOC134459274 isoform X2 [Engraulis encrasicolus]